MTSVAGAVCAHCGTALRRKGNAGPFPTYCSGTCKARACSTRAELDGRAAGWAAAAKTKRAKERKQRRRALPSIACGFCEVWFTPLQRKRRYCSKECCSAAFSVRRRSTPEGRRKRYSYDQARVARKKGDPGAGPIVAAEVFERDGWVCQLCLRPIPTNVAKRHPMSPSIDHVVPLSKGGLHTWENVQTAHLICNGRKGNRP